MDRTSWTTRVKSVLCAIPLLILLVIAAVVLLEPRQDDLTSFSSRIKEEVGQEILGIRLEKPTPQYAKELSLQELKHLLVSTSQPLRAAAIRAIGERGEVGLVPTLIKMLNDNTPLNDVPNQAPASTAQLAKQALANILRVRISKEPGNMAVLIPFLEGAARGTPQERRGCIELLGDIKEPLAVPLLSLVSQTDENPNLRESAQSALSRITRDQPAAQAYELIRGTQLQVIIVMFGTVVAMTGFLLRRLLHPGERLFGVLALVPIVLCGGIGSLTSIDHFRGEIEKGLVSRAVRHSDAMALRTMLYHDYTDYPGDSGIAQLLLTMGSDDVIRTLNQIPSVEPDDFDHLKLLVQQRTQWILARIVASRLDSPGLLAMAHSKDSDTRLALATTLGFMGITNDRIVHALSLLEGDADPRVAKKAIDARARISNFAPLPSLRPEARAARPQS